MTRRRTKTVQIVPADAYGFKESKDAAELLEDFLRELGGEGFYDSGGISSPAKNGVKFKCYPETYDIWAKFCEENRKAINTAYKAGIKTGRSILFALQAGELTAEQVNDAALDALRKRKNIPRTGR